MSRASRILHGFSIGILNQGLTSLVGLWLTRFVLHRVGDRDFALWIMAGQLLGFLSLVDIGVATLLPREVAAISGGAAEPEARDRELRDLIGTSIVLVLALVPVLVVASVALLVFMPAEWRPISGPITFALATLVFSYVVRIGHAVLSGLQEFSFLAWVDIASWATNSALTAILAVRGYGVYALALGPAIGQVVAAVAWFARLAMRHRSILPTRVPRVGLRASAARLVTGMSVTLNRVAHTLLSGTDLVVIGKILGPSATLQYSFTDKGEALINNQPYMMAELAGPALAQVRASEPPERFASAVGAMAGVVVVFSGGLAIAVLAFNHAFVRAWIGEQHFGGLLLTGMLLANMVARHLQFSFGVAVFYAGRIREITILSLADGVVSVGLTIVLVREIGIVGAPVASLASMLLTQTPWTLVILRQETGRGAGATLSSLVPWLVRFLPILAAAWVAGTWLGPRSVVESAIAAAFLAAVYGLAMLPLLRRPPLDAYAGPLLSKFANIWRRLLRTAEGT